MQAETKGGEDRESVVLFGAGTQLVWIHPLGGANDLTLRLRFFPNISPFSLSTFFP